MNKYDVFAPGERAVPFSPHEMDMIENSFPDGEKPIHFVFRSEFRYNKETHKTGIVAISPHWVKIFRQKRYGEKPKQHAEFHILDVEFIAHSDEEFILVKTPNSNFICTSRQALRFAQILFRNYTLSMNLLSEKYDLEVRSSRLEMFPDFSLYVSPSQKFQFAYFAFCSYCNQPYRHDIVRYMHNLICSMNPVIDMSKLPLECFSGGEIIEPLVKTLELTKYALGICCEDRECSNLIDLILPLMDEESGIRLVHLKNCGIESGLKSLAERAAENGAIRVGYWNLSGNEISDFRSFSRIIELSFAPIYFIGISYCGISESVLADIFNALANNTYAWELKELHVAGLPVCGKALDELEAFLQRLNQKKHNRLTSIDLSAIDGSLNDVLTVVTNEIPKISTLILRDNEIHGDVLGLLTSFIRDTRHLKVLDVSGTGISPDDVAEIILAFEENVDLTEITLKIDDLKLNGTRLLPLFRAFLTGDSLSDQKWKSLSLNRNGMTCSDLRNLIPLFEQLPNLEELSLSGNFNKTHEAPYIAEVLVELVSLESLKKLHLAGDEAHKLGSDLASMLGKLKQKCYLKELDISNNDMGDTTFSLVNQLLAHNLEKVWLDDNGVASVEVLMDLCSAVRQNKNLITVGFPVNDGNAISKGMKGREREVQSQRVGDLQTSVVTYTASHRRRRGFVNELPFEPLLEVSDMLRSLTSDFTALLNGDNLYQHTCFTDDFGLPLPFQRTGESSKDIRKRHKVEIGELEVYETESMKYIVIEDRALNETIIAPPLQNEPSADPRPESASEKSSSIEKPRPRPKIRDLQTVVVPGEKLDELDHKHRHNKQSNRRRESSSEDEYDTGEYKRKANKKQARASKRRQILSSESSDEYEYSPKKRTARASKRKRPLPSESSDEYEYSSKKRHARAAKRRVREYSDDDDDYIPPAKRIPQRKDYKNAQYEPKKIKSEFDVPSSMSSTSFERLKKKNIDDVPRQRVKKAPAPVLGGGIKPIMPKRGVMDDNEEIDIAEMNRRQQRRRIERNSALDDTPPDTLFDNRALARLFDKD